MANVNKMQQALRTGKLPNGRPLEPHQRCMIQRQLNEQRSPKKAGTIRNTLWGTCLRGVF